MSSKGWRRLAERIFQEERVRYRIDERCGVHLTIDEEFERSRASTIAGLAGTRYGNAAEQFDQAHQQLDATPPDGKGAVRGVFHAAEGLFRLMSGRAILGNSDARTFLAPLLAAQFVDDVPARVASTKMLAAFEDWIVSCHQYRHEPGTEEPAQPPMGLAILLVSQGAGFIRWLVEIDGQIQDQAKA